MIPDRVLMDEFRRPRARGKQSKLSASQRNHLLELHDAGTHTQEELAEPFSVSRTTLSWGLQRRAATASS